MEAKFSPRVKDVISFSREEALRIGNDFIGVEHLLLGLIREGEGKAIKILNEKPKNLFFIDDKDANIKASGKFGIRGAVASDTFEIMKIIKSL